MKQKIYAMGITALQWGLLLVGLHGNKACWNVYIFLLFISLFMSAVLLVGSVVVRANLPERAFPFWFYTGSDFALGVVLAAYGHFFLAAVTVIQLVAEGAAFTKVPGRERVEPVTSQQGWRF